MPYNPFDKPIGERLIVDDLQQLIKRQVVEGYTVEYKSTFQENHKIGKSIASFANTYGGWYFIGVEADKTNNVATNICGFNLKDVPNPIDTVREIIKSHIDPVPVFYPQVVYLEKEQVVLVVYIPGEQETPFINKNGRIYRRQADSSDPVYEKDRYTLDRLVDNGREVAKRFGEFCQDERTFSEAEGQAWVKIFLSPYPLGTINRFEIASEKVIEELLELSKTPIEYRASSTQHWGYANFPFNFGQPTPNSVILQQVNLDSLAYNNTSVEFFRDGRAKFFIALEHQLIKTREDIEKLQSSQVKQVLSHIWGNDQYISHLSYLRFIDIGQLFAIVAALFNYYREWLGDEFWSPDIKIAVTLEDVWRAVPFFDWDEWGDHVKKFGLPVSRQDTITIPYNPSRAIPISLDDRYGFWMTLAGLIGLAFHLPTKLTSEIINETFKRHAKPTEEWETKDIFTKKSQKIAK